MLRSLFYALLLANVGYFAWSQWVARPAVGTAPRVAADVPRPATGRILLVGEGAPPAAGTDAVSSGIGVAGPLPEAQCMSVGPFRVARQALEATAFLDQRGYQPRQRTVDGQVPAGYMVMVAALRSPAEQERVVARLKRAGLPDAFALPRLDAGYAVSVGQFSEASTAERRARVVANLGLAAEVVGRQRPGSVYWLDIRLERAIVPGQTPQSLFWPGEAAAPLDPAGMGDPTQWEFAPCADG
jgi:hypothetical protein